MLVADGYFWPMCEFISCFALGLYLGLPYHQVVLAYERCVFCWPMNYNRQITATNMTCFVFCIYVVTLSYRFILTGIVGTHHQASHLFCIYPRLLVRIYILTVVFFILPLVLLIVFTFLIGKTTWTARLAPAMPQGVTIPPPPPILRARKTRMI